jgi:DNA-binding MarR family transcriptional regulator
MTHLHVLRPLRHHGAMPLGRLADLLGRSMSSTTGIVDRMEERRFVERVRVPDDRRVGLVDASGEWRGQAREAEHPAGGTTAA